MPEENEVLEGELVEEPTTALALRDARAGKLLKPEVFKERLGWAVTNRRNLMEAIFAELVAGVDFGLIHKKYKKRPTDREWARCSHGENVIKDADGQPVNCPECDAKHSLWKGGAEVVVRFNGAVPRYRRDDETLEILKDAGKKGVIPYICLATTEDGSIAAEGRGSASLEDNYGDVNKTIKMAKKSALVDAALSFGLSGMFTQDIEKESDYDKKPAPAPAASPPPAQSKPAAAPAEDASGVLPRLQQGATLLIHIDRMWEPKGDRQKFSLDVMGGKKPWEKMYHYSYHDEPLAEGWYMATVNSLGTPPPDGSKQWGKPQAVERGTSCNVGWQQMEARGAPEDAGGTATVRDESPQSSEDAAQLVPKIEALEDAIKTLSSEGIGALFTSGKMPEQFADGAAWLKHLRGLVQGLGPDTTNTTMLESYLNVLNMTGVTPAEPPPF